MVLLRSSPAAVLLTAACQRGLPAEPWRYAKNARGWRPYRLRLRAGEGQSDFRLRSSLCVCSVHSGSSVGGNIICAWEALNLPGLARRILSEALPSSSTEAGRLSDVITKR